MTPITISFDDLDSPDGGCTTHFTGLLLARLSRLPGVYLLDYPGLVRLNPAVPWKTRGNAATVLRLAVTRDPMDVYEEAVRLASEYVEGARRAAGKAPGVAYYPGAAAWEDAALRKLYRAALTGIVPLDVAVRAVERGGGRLWGGRGRVGAAAALAALAPGDDYTFELAAYREPGLWGSARCVVEGPEALRVEARMPPCTFNNVSPTGRLAAAPRGPDPVLAGFRGDCPWELAGYSRLLCERPQFWVLYRSNQHTDAHAIPLESLSPYSSGSIRAVVAGAPERLPGGHVVARVETPLGPVDAAFYRETGPLRDAAALLEPGDVVVLHGSVRPYAPRGRPTLAVEKMVVAGMAGREKVVAPRCPRCGRRMKSSGRGKGYKCPHCGYRDPEARPVTLRLTRRLVPGVYAPPEGELGHLTMPPWRRPAAAPPARPRFEWVLSTGPQPPSHPPASTGAH